jgi:hypothetical protein
MLRVEERVRMNVRWMRIYLRSRRTVRQLIYFSRFRGAYDTALTGRLVYLGFNSSVCIDRVRIPNGSGSFVYHVVIFAPCFNVAPFRVLMH